MTPAEAPAVRRPAGASKRTRLRLALLVVVTIVLVAVTTALARPDRTVQASPAGTAVPAGTPVRSGGSAATPPAREATSSQALLTLQTATLGRSDRAAFLATWMASRPAQRWGAEIYAHLMRLGIGPTTAQLDPSTLAGTRARWTAQVQVRWHASPEAGTATSSLTYTFGQADGRPRVLRVSALSDTPEPVWLLPGLVVRAGPRALVAAGSTTGADRAERLLQQAATAVGRVLPRWHGSLTAYVPATMAQFNALIAARPGQYRGIAAVTTTVDGSKNPSVPTVMVLNPRVFAGLGPIGAHVVVTHEATHVATHAAVVPMPLWLAEGFADYVAIGSVHLPFDVAARAALSAVRRHGVPTSLPSNADFGLAGHGLEATYERAWLANRLIAQIYGQRRLVSLYRRVEAHPGTLVDQMRSVLHTTEAAFTARWRRELRNAARAG